MKIVYLKHRPLPRMVLYQMWQGGMLMKTVRTHPCYVPPSSRGLPSSFFFLNRSCLRFIYTNSTGGDQPPQQRRDQTSPSMLTVAEKTCALSLCRALDTFGSWSRKRSWSWSCSQSGLGLSLGLALCQQSLSPDAGTSMLPELGVGKVGKLIELVLDALWDLGLALLGLYKGLTASAPALMALALLACIFLRPVLLCFSAKRVFLRNSAPSPLRGSHLHGWGFSMLLLGHFQDGLCMLWFLDLAVSALMSRVPGTKEKEGGHQEVLNPKANFVP